MKKRYLVEFGIGCDRFEEDECYFPNQGIILPLSSPKRAKKVLEKLIRGGKFMPRNYNCEVPWQADFYVDWVETTQLTGKDWETWFSAHLSECGGRDIWAHQRKALNALRRHNAQFDQREKERKLREKLKNKFHPYGWEIKLNGVLWSVDSYGNLWNIW